MKYDVCIVGGAGGGLSAAIKAAEHGAKVVVLEKMATTGGCTKMAGGILGLETPVQERMVLHYDLDQAFKELMTVNNWDADGKLVRKWLNGMGENIRWLETLGVVFSEAAPPQSYAPHLRKSYHVTSDIRTGFHIWKSLLRACERLGIDIIVSARATHLLQEDGHICGVVYEKNGEEFSVEVNAVILATGSISANKELLKRFYNGDQYRNMRIMADVPHNTGDGLLMAEEIGAGTGQISTLFIGPHNHFAKASQLVGTIPRRPHPIKVDRNGERFIDESWSTNSEFGWMQSVAIDYIPGKVSYAIMDQAMYHNMYSDSVKPFGMMEAISFGNLNVQNSQEFIAVMDREIEKEIQGGRAFKANTLEELAAYIGCDSATLVQTVAEYNSYCDKGHDDMFLKDPQYLIPIRTGPFYAFLGPSGIDTCIGGLKIDHRQRVLDRDDCVIPGLYAAGVMTSGWLGHLYAFGGSEMSYTIYSGRSAGTEAALFAKGSN